MILFQLGCMHSGLKLWFFLIVYVILAKNHVPEKTDTIMNLTFTLLGTIKYYQPFKGLYGALCLAIVTKIQYMGFVQTDYFVYKIFAVPSNSALKNSCFILSH